MDFDGWIGCELGEVERERFVRVHEALVAAGPPARLPPALRRPPPVARPVPFGWTMPPRRRAPQLAAAAAAVVCFGAASAGYLLSTGSGRGGDGWVRMRATAVAPLASGQLWVGGRDPAGNWPLMLRVHGLPPGRYEMLLTERGRFVGGCGWFRAGAATTTVTLTAPYRLDEGSDWVITRGRLDAPLLRTVGSRSGRGVTAAGEGRESVGGRQQRQRHDRRRGAEQEAGTDVVLAMVSNQR